jgi:hypothetical protein
VRFQLNQPFSQIEKQLSTLNAQKDLQNWNPELSGDIDIRITVNGDWIHEGSKIERAELIKLFSSILRRENDGQYYLVTPVEKWRIQVDDAPLLVTHIDVSHANTKDQTVQFTLNNGDQGTVSKDQALRVETSKETGEPAPYIDLPNHLFAKLNRASFYHLVEQAEIRGDQMGITSDGHWFLIGSIE